MVNTQPNSAFGVKNGLQPNIVPKMVPFTIDFSAQTSFAIDLLMAQQSGMIDFVQSIFIDNSLNLNPLTINPTIGLQNVAIPPKSQAYLPILAPSPAKINFSTGATAGLTVIVALCNIPLPATVWPAAEYIPNFNSSGAILTADSILDNTVVNGMVNTSNQPVQGIYNPTFQSVSIGNAGYATPTDFFGIVAGANAISLSAFQIRAKSTTATNVDYKLFKRTAANTGGTPSTPTIVSLNSALPAATATPVVYGSAPSALGAGAQLYDLATNTNALTGAATWGGMILTNIILQPGEGYYANFNGVALPSGMVWDFLCAWVELP